jgi:predicted dehydrogenase
MGVVHTAHLHMTPGVRVTAGVDVDPALGKALRGIGFRVPWFRSLDEALQAVHADGVIISTPTHTHAELASLAAERGLDFLVEKPLAHTLSAARVIADAARAGGVVASCGYTLAHLPTFEKAKALLEEGGLGRIHRFESSMYIGQVLGRMRGWHYDPKRSGGGVVANVTSHLLFLLEWYLGGAHEVEATTERRFTEVDDEARIRLRFADGVEGSVASSWSVPGYALSRTRILIHGENGTLDVSNDSMQISLQTPWGDLPAGATSLHAADLPQRARFSLGGEGYAREIEEFVDAMRGGPPVRTSIERALSVQIMIDGIYRSAEQGGAAVHLSGRADAQAAR